MHSTTEECKSTEDTVIQQSEDVAQYEDKINDLTAQLNTEKQAHENTKKLYQDLLAASETLKQKADEAIISNEKIENLTTEKNNLERMNSELQTEVNLRCEQLKEYIKKGDQVELNAEAQIQIE